VVMRDAHSSSRFGFSRARKHSQLVYAGMRLVAAITNRSGRHHSSPKSSVGGRGCCRRRVMPWSTVGPPCGALSLMCTSRPPSSCQDDCLPQQRCPLSRSHAVADGEDSSEVHIRWRCCRSIRATGNHVSRTATAVGAQRLPVPQDRP
jgi:hypothetical protein